MDYTEMIGWWVALRRKGKGVQLQVKEIIKHPYSGKPAYKFEDGYYAECKRCKPFIQRKENYRPDEVLPYVLFIPKIEGKELKRDYDGDLINMASDRYKCFATSGLKCVSCGIEGIFFAKERKNPGEPFHFNLYAIQNGDDVLMTKDHIIPISNGGKNYIDNYQTMCCRCNSRKGNMVE